MSELAPLGLALTALVSGWVALLRFAGAARDERLLASAVRGCHATAALTLLASAGTAATLAADLPSWESVAVAMWESRGARTVVWAFAAAVAAALVPRLAREDPPRAKATALMIAAGAPGLLALGALLEPWEALGVDGSVDGALVEAQTATGIVHALLELAGYATFVAIGALRLSGAPEPRVRRPVRLALALLAAALLADAWRHYAGVAAVTELPPAPDASWPEWRGVDALPLIPPLMLVAHLYWTTLRRAAWLTFVVVGVLAASAAVPMVLDWVAARPIGRGLLLTPPRLSMLALPLLLAALATAWPAVRRTGVGTRRATPAAAIGGASIVAAAAVAGVRGWPWLTCIALAGALAALVLSALPEARTLAGRAGVVAQAALALCIAGAAGALSTRPQLLEIMPGARQTVAAPGGGWQVANQGVSHEESPSYDGSVVALDLSGPRGDGFATPGERRYRDPHGHEGPRAVVPALRTALAGDLRFTAPGLRGEAAIIRAWYHPLAGFAFAAGLLVVIGAAAACLRPEPPA